MIAVLLSLGLAHADVPFGPRPVDEVLATFAHEPDVRDVHRWAEQLAHASPERLQAALRRTRRAAALPTVWVGYRLTNDRDQDLRYVAADGVTDQHDDHLLGLPEEEAFGRQGQLTLQARWDLDELLVSPEHLRMLDEAGDATKRRQEVLVEVNRLYFERRRLQVTELLEPTPDTASRARRALRIAELTANLDALTDGRFSTALTRTESR